MSAAILHTSSYCFHPLPEAELPALREQLLARCEALRLKGTILLGTEGMNLMLAGPADSIKTIQAELNTLFSASLFYKDSPCRTQPFNRLLIKIKKEVVTMGELDLDVQKDTAPYLDPKDLKRWIEQGSDDEGRRLMILDTRNDYEVRIGTFEGAEDFDIQNFRQFPEKIKSLTPEEFDDTCIVTVCTGGIRCEKGAPFMRKQGFSNVWQLEGGILNYFMECGGEHWKGDCFVFDHRVAVDPSMAETETVQCFACRMPVTAEEQKQDNYVFGLHCPHCAANTMTPSNTTEDSSQMSI